MIKLLLTRTALNFGGTVNDIFGTLSLRGDAGANGLVLQDSSDSTPDTVTINATQIGSDPGDSFLGVSSFGARGTVTYTGMDDVTLNMGSGSDEIDITPADSTRFFVNGNNPAGAIDNGDRLNLNVTGVFGFSHEFVTEDSGRWLFANRESIFYTGIENLSLDRDGISDTVEAGAPNNGDGNGDGVPDNQQSNVVSLPNRGDGQYVTLVSPSGTSLINVVALDRPFGAPVGVEFPVGAFNFRIEGLERGSRVQVKLYLSSDVELNTYYKSGTGDVVGEPIAYEFLRGDSGLSDLGADISGKPIVLYLQDGMDGDDDKKVNGVILDPGGPAFDPPPTADAGLDRTVPEGSAVHLTGAFTDPGILDPHSFNWQVVSNNGQVILEGDGQDFDFTPNDNGTYTVTFRVTDNDGGVGTDEVVITVTNVAPSASVSGPPDSVRGQTQEFTLLAIDLSPVDQAAGFTYLIDWNDDGNFNDQFSGAGPLTAEHAYEETGLYTIRVVAVDQDGGQSEPAFHAIEIAPAPLMVALDDKTRLYGDANPDLTGVVSGILNGEDVVVTFTTSASVISGVGNYTITAQVTGADAGKYSVSIQDGILSVTSAPLSVYVNDAWKFQSQPNPTFTGKIAGIKNSDAITAAYSSAADSGSPPGDYYIDANLSGAKLANYEVTVHKGTLEVIKPASFSGLVFEDFNDDGEVDFGERGIAGVTVRLQGTDDLGRSIDMTTAAEANGLYQFNWLRKGSYTITETQPGGYTQGINSIGTAGGTKAADQFFIELGKGIDGLNYNFGERPPAGAGVQKGQTAGIGFWNNKNGQALIKSLNGGAGTQLGDWLAATFVNLFGAHAGSVNDLAGRNNLAIASYFQSLFSMGGPKLEAQVLATALSVYVTNATLDNTKVGEKYGFTVSGDGVGRSTFNVGTSGQAFGVANKTMMTVMDLLLATDAQAVDGVLYGGNKALRNLANTVFGALNQAGGIS